LRQAVSKAWQHVASGEPWQKLKRDIGFAGSIRALEVTTGPNGWHPHLHLLIFTKKPLSESLDLAFRDFVFSRWCRSIQRSGYRLPTEAHGMHFGWSEKDEYIAKMGLAEELSNIAAELTQGGAKLATGSNRTPLQVLMDYMEHGSDEDGATWREYTAGMKGARQLTWSVGLRAQFLRSEELTDEEAARLCVYESEETEMIVIPAVLWQLAVKRHPHVQWTLLEAAELGVEALKLVWDSVKPGQIA
jgi:hypothetical protein